MRRLRPRQDRRQNVVHSSRHYARGKQNDCELDIADFLAHGIAEYPQVEHVENK